MPELPEVETIRRDLAPALEGATIVSVRIQKPDIIMSGESPRTFAASLRGRHISAVERRGKNLLLRFPGSDDGSLRGGTRIRLRRPATGHAPRIYAHSRSV